MKKHETLRLIVISLSIVFGSVHAQENNMASREVGEPEAATGYIEKQAFIAEDYMVVAANPYASWAGRRIIEDGGSAIDAAVAIQAMLTLVEPQSSGIGGGAFILYWDNKEKILHTFDGREMAPSDAKPNLFEVSGKPMKWRDAVVGGKSVGVPGVLHALHTAHQKFGKLEWARLFSETIDTSVNGFTVSPRLHKLLALDIHPGVRSFPSTSRYFFPAGKPLEVGITKKNPALAKTLSQIATKGIDYFYTGELPQRIAHAVQHASINPGVIKAEDFANYKTIERTPVCGFYRKHKVCGMAPPSSGGINVLQILKSIEQYDLSTLEPNSETFVHLYSQASALAYADRDMYIADTDFTQLPYAALINDAYLNSRAELVNPDAPMRKFRAGKPYTKAQLGPDYALELPNTSHISIVDKSGNAVSMTTSIEFMFGSGIMVDGFLLNNQMTDFSLSARRNGYLTLNRIQPGKRPRSAMSPTMVFDNSDNLSLVVGSPGGSRIISYVTQTIIGVLDWGLDIQQSINLPKVTNRNDYTALEKGTPITGLQNGLEAKGHNVRVIDLNSGLHGIQLKDGKIIGGADPRREGVAVGF